MWTNNLLYIVFITQIFFISFYFPRQLIKRTKRILKEHPQSEFPRLYPVSSDVFDMGLRSYRNSNFMIVLIGALIVLHGLYYQSVEMLFADNMVVLLGYFMLQWTPLLLVEFSGYKYLKLMRLANTQTKRKAMLKPRGILNYIAISSLLLAVGIQLLYLGLVPYFVFNPFDGFGGLANLGVILFADAFFVGILLWNIKGKNKNPYLKNSDREKHIKRLARVMVLTSNLMIAFLSLDLILSATDSRHLIDTFMSLYFLLIASVSYQAYQVEDIDFDVYRDSIERAAHE